MTHQAWVCMGFTPVLHGKTLEHPTQATGLLTPRRSPAHQCMAVTHLGEACCRESGATKCKRCLWLDRDQATSSLYCAPRNIEAWHEFHYITWVCTCVLCVWSPMVRSTMHHEVWQQCTTSASCTLTLNSGLIFYYY